MRLSELGGGALTCSAIRSLDDTYLKDHTVLNVTRNANTWTGSDFHSITVPTDYENPLSLTARINASATGTGGLIRASIGGVYTPEKWGIGVVDNLEHFLHIVASPGDTITFQFRVMFADGSVITVYDVDILAVDILRMTKGNIISW